MRTTCNQREQTRSLVGMRSRNRCSSTSSQLLAMNPSIQRFHRSMSPRGVTLQIVEGMASTILQSCRLFSLRVSSAVCIREYQPRDRTASRFLRSPSTWRWPCIETSATYRPSRGYDVPTVRAPRLEGGLLGPHGRRHVFRVRQVAPAILSAVIAPPPCVPFGAQLFHSP